MREAPPGVEKLPKTPSLNSLHMEEPPFEGRWRYETVIDAINDGWRVISFPNMALSLDENRTYGLGFEFVLEKWN